MRHVLALAIGLGLVWGLGCHHETCDCENPVFMGCCPRDICSGCGGHYYVPPTGAPVPAAPKPEEIRKLPTLKDSGVKLDQSVAPEAAPNTDE
jgi:hypothetical protein